jgi:UDP-GlcNAc3NAcA epimerase
VILRPQTEWVEIVENGNAILADASKKRIITAFEDLTAKNDLSYPPLYGDGKAAVFICEKIVNDL